MNISSFENVLAQQNSDDDNNNATELGGDIELGGEQIIE